MSVDNVTVSLSRLALAKAIKTPDSDENDAEPWQNSIIFHQSHIPQPPPKQRRGAPPQGRPQQQQQQQRPLKSALKGGRESRSAEKQNRDMRGSSGWRDSKIEGEDANNARPNTADQKRSSEITRAMPKSRLMHQYAPSDDDDDAPLDSVKASKKAPVASDDEDNNDDDESEEDDDEDDDEDDNDEDDEDDDDDILKPVPHRSSQTRSSLTPSAPGSSADSSTFLGTPLNPFGARRVSASAVEVSSQGSSPRALRPMQTTTSLSQGDGDDEDVPLGAHANHKKSSSLDRDMMATVMAAGIGASRLPTVQHRGSEPNIARFDRATMAQREPSKEEPERVSAIENWRRTMVEDTEGAQPNPYHDMTYYDEQRASIPPDGFDANSGQRSRLSPVMDQFGNFAPLAPPATGRYERARRNTLEGEMPIMVPIMPMQQPMATRSMNPNRRSMQRNSMSGMEMMLEREAQRAELTKNQRRSNPKQPQIEGLLAKLPAQGMATINFQQQQQSAKPSSKGSRSPNMSGHHHSPTPLQKKRSTPTLTVNRPASSMGFADGRSPGSSPNLSGEARRSPRHLGSSSGNHRSVSPHGPRPTPSHSTPILPGMMMDPAFGGQMFLASRAPPPMMGLGVNMGNMGNMGNMSNMGPMMMMPMGMPMGAPPPMGTPPMGTPPMGTPPMGGRLSVMGGMGPGGHRRPSVGWNGQAGTF